MDQVYSNINIMLIKDIHPTTRLILGPNEAARKFSFSHFLCFLHSYFKPTLYDLTSLRQHGGQERVSWVVCWRRPLVQRCAEKEHQSLAFTVTIC